MKTKYIVKVSLSEIINSDADSFLDLLSELAIGDSLLMDINYQIIGLGDELNTIMIEILGDDSKSKQWNETE